MSAKSMQGLYDYALTFFGMPYQWGGGSRSSDFGIDCSGLVQKLLAYAKCDPAGDQTADDLYHYFMGNGIQNAFGIGALAFFGTTSRIHHVGFALDPKIMISASGGGRHVTTRDTAKRLGASVKIEPIRSRMDFVVCLMPNYQLPQGA